MSSLFADNHNMVAILAKSDAAEGFEQIIDFLNGSYIHYALTENPHIYVSCIKQFCNTSSVKHSDDVTRLQALVDRKKIVISEDVIRKILQLDDAEGVVCLPNEEIFAGLAQMGYEKPLVRNVDSSSKFYMYPWFIQLIIQNQIGDLSTHTTRYIFPTLTQKVFANIRRVVKGFSGGETPLFEGMLTAREIAKEGIAEEQVQADDVVAAAVQETVAEDVANEAIPSTPTPLILPSPPSHDIPSTSQKLEIIKLKARVKRLERVNKVKSSKLRHLKKVGTSQRIESSDDMKDVFNQGRMIDDLDKDEGIELVVDEAEIYHLDLDHPSKVLSMQDDDLEVQEVVKVVTTDKLITEVVTTATSQVSAASATISAAKTSIPAATLTVVATISAAKPSIPAAAPTVDKGKGILIETPKPMKKKDQIELDAEYARKLHEEINKDIDWDAAIDHVKQKSKENPQFDANMRFLFKSREEIEEEDREVLKSINETPAQKAAKRRKLNEEAQEVEDLKKHLEIVNDEDDEVFTEATPLVRK
nr:hypothetical protein [Tanacetum cinerariifolium]